MKTKYKVGDLVRIRSSENWVGSIPFSPFPWKINNPETAWVENNFIGLIVQIEECSLSGPLKYYYGVLCGTQVASINDDYLETVGSNDKSQI